MRDQVFGDHIFMLSGDVNRLMRVLYHYSMVVTEPGLANREPL